jgi:uncharacterized protein involved in response to NO
MLLAAIWILGRIAAATSAHWPPWSVAGLDLLFFPWLAAMVLPPLLRARSRSTLLLVVLVALWAADIAFHRALVHGDAGAARRALRVGIDIVLVLVTAVGGRIIPVFTRAALEQAGFGGSLRTSRTVTPLAIGAMVGATLVDIWRPEGSLAGAAALAAAAVQLARLAQWRSLHTLRTPIVWVLHMGYLWLVVALLLKGLALLAGLAIAAFYLHALTIGAATTMILAVMTRASLGHTGRPLIASRPTACAYVLLTVAAAVRVFGPAIIPMPYTDVVLMAAALWTTAFVLFLAVYAPILFTPRIDGKPG